MEEVYGERQRGGVWERSCTSSYRRWSLETRKVRKKCKVHAEKVKFGAYLSVLLLFQHVLSALTLLAGRQKGHPACKNGGMVEGGNWSVRMQWRPASWLVSASVNLPLLHKAQKFSSGTSPPGWSRKKSHKMVVVVVWC